MEPKKCTDLGFQKGHLKTRDPTIILNQTRVSNQRYPLGDQSAPNYTHLFSILTTCCAQMCELQSSLVIVRVPEWCTVSTTVFQNHVRLPQVFVAKSSPVQRLLLEPRADTFQVSFCQKFLQAQPAMVSAFVNYETHFFNMF